MNTVMGGVDQVDVQRGTERVRVRRGREGVRTVHLRLRTCRIQIPTHMRRSRLGRSGNRGKGNDQLVSFILFRGQALVADERSK